MNKTNFVAATMLACFVCTPAFAQNTQPLKGTYQCEMNFQHMMPGKSGTAMVSSANCKLDGDDKNVTIFSNNVMFNEKGVGDLINSNGVTLQEGKPITAYIGNQATWTLKMKDGQMVGYTANGVNKIIAGENVGKDIHWTAKPTGADTAAISYEVR